MESMQLHLSAAPGIELPHLSFPSLAAGSVTNEGNVYTVNVGNKVGTSVFQPGDNPKAPRQIAQGLVGVLIVTPAACTGVNLTCAFDGTSHADEALVATTDLDLAFAQNPDTYDMSYFGQSRTDKDRQRQVYHVINGQSFPDTQVIDAQAGDSVLLRYVNAGVTDKTMGLLGLRQTLLARNASPYKDPQTFVAPMVGPGETADVVVQVPLSATAGQRYSLMDQSRQMNHGSAFGFGGALTFINVWTGAVGTPTVDTLALSVGTLSAHGQSSAPAFKITGYQIAVTSTNTPPTTFALPVLLGLGSASSVTITAPVAANPGDFVWIQVIQEGTGTSTPMSIQVPIPDTPFVDGAAYDFASQTLTATGHASPSTQSISGYQTAVNGGAWSSTVTVTPTATASISAVVPAASGDTLSIRVLQNATWSLGASTVASAPIVVPPTATGSMTGTVLSFGGASDTSLTITAAEYFIGTDPGPGLGVGIVDLSATAPGTISLITGAFGASTINATADLGFTPNSGDQVRVRVRDSNGTWSAAVLAL